MIHAFETSANPLAQDAVARAEQVRVDELMASLPEYTDWMED